ncbi:VWA domain-containing protein [Candidatus Woesearchaeota archaeon]|nr:VWA domain-containing protein [Candidatus Woesearchaeota archaeon]
MVVLPNLSKVFCISKFCLRYSYLVLLIILVVAALYFLIKRNFVRFADKGEQSSYDRSKQRKRMIFFTIRSLIFALVIFSIASPFILEQTTVKGNPRITILVDNSSSFNLFDGKVGSELAEKLKGNVPVTLRHIAAGEKSAIGDGILNNIDRDENVLVITDGNSNSGKLLGDIMLLAASLNTTVSTLSLEPVRSDVNVVIEGPSEAIKDSEENFIVRVNNVGRSIPYTLEVRLDEEIVLAQSGDESKTFTINKKLTEGYHKFKAELLNVGSEDHFSQNNAYYKTVKVFGRPKILFVSEKSSPMVSDLNEIYDVSVFSEVPGDLSQYLATVLNDLPINKIEPHYEKIEKYVEDGNGLIVIGGQNSYDRGGYKNPGILFPSLLPVKIGTGEEGEKSDIHIVVALDVSGSTIEVINQRGEREFRNYDDVIKALGVSVLDSLHEKNNVGAVVIGTYSSPFVGKVQDIYPLKDKKKELVDKFSRLKGGGQSEIEGGIKLGHKMLDNAGGGKNIVLISDGRGIGLPPQIAALEAVRQAASRGIKTYVVGVGAVDRQEQEFLSKVALFGEGVYFPADASNKLKILFGEPEGKDKDFFNSLVILDNTHFITLNVSLEAVVSGYNFVLPKPNARILVTTNKNIPILVAGRYGSGRIVALGTDDGGKWAGELLNKRNSKLITKSINWAIGDLGRKKDFDVNIKDTTIDKSALVSVIANSVPKHEKLSFVKSDVNLYTSFFEPTRTGFHNVLGADFAVNYNSEYEKLGLNREFTSLVTQTGGKVFERDDVEEMIAFIKEKSKRIKVDATEFKWPFVLAAIILLLFEIFLRRIWENKSYM